MKISFSKPLLCALPLCLLACKTRLVNTTKTITAAQIDSIAVKKQVSTAVDTGKIITFTTKKAVSTDSARVTIVTDSGTVQTVNIAANGLFSYTGHAKSISYTVKKQAADTTTEYRHEARALTTTTLQNDSVAVSKTLKTSTAAKQVESKPANTLFYWLGGIFTVLFVGGFVTYKLFTKA